MNVTTNVHKLLAISRLPEKPRRDWLKSKQGLEVMVQILESSGLGPSFLPMFSGLNVELRSEGYPKRHRKNGPRLKNSNDSLTDIFARGCGQERDTQTKVILHLHNSNGQDGTRTVHFISSLAVNGSKVATDLNGWSDSDRLLSTCDSYVQHNARFGG